VTPDVLVASALDDGAGLDDGAAPAPAATTTAPAPAPVKKPSIQVDEQLNKALDILKSKAA
jgi:carboxyl-terminal processing protease